MKLRKTLAAAGALAIAGGMLTIKPATAEDTSHLVSTTVVGTITLTTPPAPAVLTAPLALPGNATGSSAMTVTSNTAYNVTVKGATARLQTLAGTALGNDLSIASSGGTGITHTGRAITTTAQKIVSAPGGAVDAIVLDFTQPLTAADATGAYSNTLTYTISAGL